MSNNRDYNPDDIELDNRRMIYSAIVTPDGTKLESLHRHDYKTHVDENGEEYMIDGGNDYFRTNVNKEPARRLVIYEDEDIETVRHYFRWGSYGKNGDEDLHWIRLKDMTDDHIKNILKNVKTIYAGLFLRELQYRIEKEIEIHDNDSI